MEKGKKCLFGLQDNGYFRGGDGGGGGGEWKRYE